MLVPLTRDDSTRPARSPTARRRSVIRLLVRKRRTRDALVFTFAMLVVLRSTNATTRKDALLTECYPVKDIVFGSNVRASVDDLAETLQQATDPDYWQRPGRSLMAESSGVLLVTANPDMHEKVAAVLHDIRRSPAPRR